MSSSIYDFDIEAKKKKFGREKILGVYIGDDGK